MKARFPDATILIVDDEPANVSILARMLRGVGYSNLLTTTHSGSVLELIEAHDPDITLLDLMMPPPDGYAILELLRDDHAAFRPVLVLTADVSRGALERALGLGARDFLTKPFDRTEVLLRIETLIETRLLYRALETERTELEQRLADQAERIRERAAATARIEAVLVADAMRPVYQPLVELATRRVVGFEALTRFELEPKRTPDVWFHEAAEVGLGPPLELKAVRTAIAGADRLPSDRYLSLNVSPETIMSNDLAGALGALPAARTVLEVTEHAAVVDYDAIVAALGPYRSAGGRLAVDDAGAGFASLRHILLLNPDIIKLDVTLTRDIDANPAKRALAAGLISFAAETGITILAEGIETDTELETLRALGVAYGQGWHIGRPGPLPD